jgi:hypothetical protein
MSTEENIYQRPTVNFDKSNWTIKPEKSFNGIVRTLRSLFRGIDVKENSFSLSGHKRAKVYKNGEDSVTVFYVPRNSTQPTVRTVTKVNESSFIEILKDHLEPSEFVISVSKNQNSLNIELPEDTSISSSVVEDVRKFVKKAPKNQKMIDSLLERLHEILLKLGYVLHTDSIVKKPRSAEYTHLTTFDADWFRINCSYSPINQYIPYGSIQIDNFKKENPKYSYWSLLFILRILKLYEVKQLEHFEKFLVKPSELEVAFDFYNHHREFLLELNSSINCEKRKFGWINQPESPFNDYKEEDDKDLLLESTHYIGHRRNPDYQIRMYNKSDVPRLEFAIKNKILRDVKVDCIEDLFTKNWILDFFYGDRINSFRINYYRTKDKALERVDPSHHYLANRSLKAFHSKIPKNKRANVWRDCFEDNNKLRAVLEESTIDFQRWLGELYLNSSIMVITKGQLLYEKDSSDDCYDDSTGMERSHVSPVIDLKSLFKQLPTNTSVTTHEDQDFIKFTIRDSQGGLLAHILVGELPQDFLESADTNFIEKFSDVFRKPQNVNKVQIRKVSRKKSIS